jgi:acetyltransferase
MTLARTLNATSVAIVGASRQETKRGYQAIKTLLQGGFDGPIYPVNPKEKRILGLRCYPRIADIPGEVDLLLITTPAETVPAILEDAASKGVGGAVVIAGGFGELGDKGKKLEHQLVEAARRAKVRLIGPNTSGMINVKTGLNLVGLRQVSRGHIALLSQSGNMALTLITEASIKSRQGFSYYVGVGNEADIRFHEYLEFFERDPETHAILMYVEGMREGRAFLQQAYRTTRVKPIIMLKSGHSPTGRRSAGSHTGALAGISEVSRTAFRRAGVTLVKNSDELFPVAETLSSQPPIRNNQVAILTDGGGHGTIASDLLSDLGINLPALTEKTRARLRKLLPAGASLENPVDVAGGADGNPLVLAQCAQILMADPGVGGILMVGLFGGYHIRFAESLSFLEEDAAHQLGKLVQQSRKPLVVHSVYNFAKPHTLDLLRYYRIPVYDSLEVASACIGALAARGEYLSSYHAKTDFVLAWGEGARKRGQQLVQAALAEGRKFLLEPEAKELLGLHGALVSQDAWVQSAEQARAAAARMKCPVALKIVSQDILHKSDAGGVLVNLESPAQVLRGYKQIMKSVRRANPGADLRGVLVSPMEAPGIEVIIGTKLDEQFGPVILFGLGGILVEMMKDVAFRVLPISPRSARKLVDEIKSIRLLNGFRGQPPADKQAIVKLLLTVSELIQAYPEIQEMDLNPVIVHPKGLRVVDARILLK